MWHRALWCNKPTSLFSNFQLNLHFRGPSYILLKPISKTMLWMIGSDLNISYTFYRNLKLCFHFHQTRRTHYFTNTLFSLSFVERKPNTSMRVGDYQYKDKHFKSMGVTDQDVYLEKIIQTKLEDLLSFVLAISNLTWKHSQEVKWSSMW